MAKTGNKKLFVWQTRIKKENTGLSDSGYSLHSLRLVLFSSWCYHPSRIQPGKAGKRLIHWLLKVEDILGNEKSLGCWKVSITDRRFKPRTPDSGQWSLCHLINAQRQRVNAHISEESLTSLFKVESKTLGTQMEEGFHSPFTVAGNIILS